MMMAASFLPIAMCSQLFLCAFVYLHPNAYGAVASVTPSAFVSSASPRHFTHGRPCNHDALQRTSVTLAAAPDDNDKAENRPRSARDRGIYARPSAAIERGSGFFIPGLEGSRIRFIFGLVVLLADAANHMLVGGLSGDWGQTIAESVSAFYGALLLLQGSIELGVERGYAGSDNEGIISMESKDGAMPNRERDSSRRFAGALEGNKGAAELIQRLAQTIITFTPATYFRFVDEDLGVLFSIGSGNEDTMVVDPNEENRLVKLSLDALLESRGGRVALPSEHPASKLLPAAATRCILVQKVNGYNGSRGCMLIGSDKLLPAFTKNDLRWIGQLADYNNLLDNK